MLGGVFEEILENVFVGTTPICAVLPLVPKDKYSTVIVSRGFVEYSCKFLSLSFRMLCLPWLPWMM
jgi:hypothetical protein